MPPNILIPPPSSSDPPPREPGSPRTIVDANGQQHVITCTTPLWTERRGISDASRAEVGEIVVVVGTCLAARVVA